MSSEEQRRNDATINELNTIVENLGDAKVSLRQMLSANEITDPLTRTAAKQVIDRLDSGSWVAELESAVADWEDSI